MTAADPVVERTAPVRLAWIEGLRGVAAAVVVIGHVLKINGSVFASTWTASGWAGRILWPFNFNGQMVPLFLMISAFSLVISEDARRTVGRPATPWGRYLRRRGWRLGPVYLLAFAFGLIVTLSVSASALAATGEADRPTWAGSLSHLALVHNAHASWAIEGNAPLWSLSYEAQLYLVLPILALLVRGWRGTVITAGALIMTLAAVGHVAYRVDLIAYFLVGVWLARTWHLLPARLLPVVAAGTVLLLLLAVYHPPRSLRPSVVVWSLAFAGVLTLMAHDRGVWLVEHRWMRAVGLRSYSLYAMHVPVVILVGIALRAAGVRGLTQVALLALLALPLIVVVVEATWRTAEIWSLERMRRA